VVGSDVEDSVEAELAKMDTSLSKGGSDESVKTVAGTKSVWADCKPKKAEYEDAMSKDECDDYWKRIYKMSGVGDGDEKAKRELRAAAYVYAAINGTSSVGNYRRNMVTASGRSIPARVLPQVLNGNIRQFFRGNMDDAYDFFVETGHMETEHRFCEKAAAKGVAASEAFCTADFLADCSKFTPLQKRAHQMAFDYGVSRARRARDGRSLEQVQEMESHATLEAQGPMTSAGRDVAW